MPGQKLALADDFFEAGKYSKALAEYKDFLATFAGDDRSDYAQFRVAECYRMDEDFALAAVEYRILINDYGYSDFIDDAFYLEGLCEFEQAPRYELNQSKSYIALSRINRFLRMFPESPRRAEAERTLSEIEDRLGKKIFSSAILYYSRKYYSSATIYFDKVIAEFPGTVWAAKGHYYKGMILQRRGREDEALVEFGKAAASAGDFKEKGEASRRSGGLSGEGNE